MLYAYIKNPSEDAVSCYSNTQWKIDSCKCYKYVIPKQNTWLSHIQSVKFFKILLIVV